MPRLRPVVRSRNLKVKTSCVGKLSFLSFLLPLVQNWRKYYLADCATGRYLLESCLLGCLFRHNRGAVSRIAFKYSITLIMMFIKHKKAKSSKLTVIINSAPSETFIHKGHVVQLSLAWHWMRVLPVPLIFLKLFSMRKVLLTKSMQFWFAIAQPNSPHWDIRGDHHIIFILSCSFPDRKWESIDLTLNLTKFT